MGYTLQHINAIKLFNSSKKLFYAAIVTGTLQASFFKCFAIHMTYPLLKLKRSILLVMYIAYKAFAAILPAKTVLP